MSAVEFMSQVGTKLIKLGFKTCQRLKIRHTWPCVSQHTRVDSTISSAENTSQVGTYLENDSLNQGTG